MAGDIRIRQAKRQLAELAKMLADAPDDEDVRRMHDQSQHDLMELELTEFRLRSENYPTDLSRKFELAKRCFAAGHIEESIGLLQEAQSEPKNRTAATTLLGQAFLKLDYSDEAIETFRRAMENREIAPEQALELRYLLMQALQAKAESARDLASAEEAEKLAAGIFAQSISYRDIRARRDSIKRLVTELRAKA